MIGDTLVQQEPNSNHSCNDEVGSQKGQCCATNQSCDENIGTQKGQWFEDLHGPLVSTADKKANSNSTLTNHRYVHYTN